MAKEKIFDRPFVLPALVLGVCFVLSAGTAAYAFYSVRALDNVITTTGSSTKQVRADSAKWTMSVHRDASEGDVPAAYGQVSRDAAVVEQYLQKQGISKTAITDTAIFADQDYSYSTDNHAPKHYNVHEDITVQSDNVDKIAQLSKDIATLVAQGIFLSPQAPEYYVSNLPELRVSLLGSAIADAKARAQQLAQSSGAHVGKLRGASSGVVQVLTPNSTDVSDYGNYDTSTIDKTVMVTARATFAVE